MIPGKSLQLSTALTVIAVSVGAMLMVGAGLDVVAILIATALVLTFLMLHQEDERLPPPALQAPDTESDDYLDLPAFRQIVHGLNAPVLVIAGGRVMTANAPALKLLGQHILGEDVRIAIRHPAAAERLTSAEPMDAPVKIDIIGLGTRAQRWAMRIIPLGRDTEQQRLFVYLEDETDMHAAERARGDFVANASHELRTPLAAILGFIETLQDPHAGGDAQTRGRFLSILESEARRMRQLVDDLMSLSRIEADKHRLPTELIAMPELIAEVLAVSRQNLGERGGDIVSALGDDLPPVQGDRLQIGQLLHNLVSNSAKYGRPGSPITVQVRAVDSAMIRLEVSDEGEGIPPDHLPRLTERFYRVDSGRSRALGGTGLGLAIVKHIVERHRGRLDIKSSMGKGTTVSVLLPQAEKKTEATEVTHEIDASAPLS
ncbi:sensor histidine kinase [Sphingobium fluviale]|uniref:histidine kinase n=1 Tax=Sphingobium fluviale TaxID=2506423 RepID=A0A4Q1KNL8_9SPHN|nr:ATP-binding protein [Sphingobium fluviale]RXR31030.1 PAS domain-containing protein [Sphingobium fluviale]